MSQSDEVQTSKYVETDKRPPAYGTQQNRATEISGGGGCDGGIAGGVELDDVQIHLPRILGAK